MEASNNRTLQSGVEVVMYPIYGGDIYVLSYAPSCCSYKFALSTEWVFWI